MLVSTAFSPNQEMLERAEYFVQHLKADYLERRKHSLATLFERANSNNNKHERLLIVEKTGLKLYHHSHLEQPFYFHPSMGMLRINRLQKGSSDPLIKLAQLREGDSFLDCTLGIGADTLVAAYAVGKTGKVVALESDYAIATIVDNSLSMGYNLPVDIFSHLAPITVIHNDHAPVLKELASESYDIVYFDPMFQAPVDNCSAALEPLRLFANYQQLTLTTITEAIRVARRMVILKAEKNSPEFTRLGFKEQIRSANFSYGTITK